MVLVGGGVVDLVLLRPADRRVAGEQPRRHAAGVRLSAGEHAGAARASRRCCSGRPIDGNRLRVRAAGDRRRGRAWWRTSRSTWCSSRRAAGARTGPTRVFLLCYVMLIASARAATCAVRCRRGEPRRAVATRFQPISPLPYLAVGDHLRPAAAGGAPAMDRPGERARDRRAAGHGAGGRSASCSRCARTCGCWPRPPRGRTRRASARWCSTRPT